MIAAVILVPAEGDPLGLCKQGPCGARPPMMWAMRSERAGWERFHSGCPADQVGAAGYTRLALVLGFEASPLVVGLDWAAEALDFTPRHIPHLWMDDFMHPGRLHRADLAMWDGLGTILFLDSDGREVSP